MFTEEKLEHFQSKEVGYRLDADGARWFNVDHTARALGLREQTLLTQIPETFIDGVLVTSGRKNKRISYVSTDGLRLFLEEHKAKSGEKMRTFYAVFLQWIGWETAFPDGPKMVVRPKTPSTALTAPPKADVVPEVLSTPAPSGGPYTLKSEKLGEVEIRGVVVDGLAWFVANDVAKALGYKSTHKALRYQLDGKGVQSLQVLTSGGVQNMNFLNKAAAYELAMNSTLPEGDTYRQFFYGKAIPRIEETGQFIDDPNDARPRFRLPDFAEDARPPRTKITPRTQSDLPTTPVFDIAKEAFYAALRSGLDKEQSIEIALVLLSDAFRVPATAFKPIFEKLYVSLGD